MLPALVEAASADGLLDAARAIMTTDTFPKVAVRTVVSLDGVPVTIAGMAKGAGMIAPDMATMLSFVFTDAPIAASVLQTFLSRQVVGTFNAITVDSDTSTSDTLMLFATGAAAAGKRRSPRFVSAEDPRAETLWRRRSARCCSTSRSRSCATAKARGNSSKSRWRAPTAMPPPRTIALSIANSPLVKTAVAGEDANWGRVVMAVGKAGEQRRARSGSRSGSAASASPTRGCAIPDYDEAAVSEKMRADEIPKSASIWGSEAGRATVWTCDLTKEYIEINGDYRS